MKRKEELSNKKKILRVIFVFFVMILILSFLFFILKVTGVWEKINLVDKVRELILSMGFWGRFIFVLLQFLQVTFIPLPSTVTTLAGVLVYGPLEASFLSFAGIMLGSVFAFFLGRKFGRKLCSFMVGESVCKKWTKFLSDGKYTFFIMMLFPMFPDDILCLVAGLTEMTWKFFVVTNIIARPIGIFSTCYLGSGQIIPYHGWGIVVWILLCIFVVSLLVMSYKYKTQIENFVIKISKKKEKCIKK